MSATTTATAVDFADVYTDNLDKVWRFVRARVPDHHEAHDVTSDVFVRAWRSWDRFDPGRGAVEPWLFTIAHRAVTDWWRGRRPEPMEVDPAAVCDEATPERDLLRAELLAQLARALEGLSQRERDGLALRFAARLSMANVAAVLGTSVGAAKMLIHRAIRQLEDETRAPTAADQQPADLEAVIDEVLERGHDTIAQSELHGLLVHLAAVHDDPVPDGLAEHVARCVQCAVEDDLDGDEGPRERESGGHGGGRGRLSGALASLMAFAGICLVCTVPALQTLLFALGVGVAGYYLHIGGLVAVPVVLWLVWRGTRRHGTDRGYRWARWGAIVLAVHAMLHVVMETVPATAVPAWVEISGMVGFVATDWLGTALLLTGAVLNLVDLQRWRRAEGARLQAVLVG